jgi:hypothetical protein
MDPISSRRCRIGRHRCMSGCCRSRRFVRCMSNRWMMAVLSLFLYGSSLSSIIVSRHTSANLAFASAWIIPTMSTNNFYFGNRTCLLYKSLSERILRYRRMYVVIIIIVNFARFFLILFFLPYFSNLTARYRTNQADVQEVC